MIAESSDIVSLAQARATDKAEGRTAPPIIRSVVDKAIKVGHDDGYTSVGVGVDIQVRYHVVNGWLDINNILGCLNRWTVDNQLSRYMLYGQLIKLWSGRSQDQSIPLGGGTINPLTVASGAWTLSL